METTMGLLSSYRKELEDSELEDVFCESCSDRGYYIVFNAYELEKEHVRHCSCLLGQMFIDNRLKSLNSPCD
jgi:hypothetical protein